MSNMRSTTAAFLMATIAFCCSACAADGPLVLVENGQPRATVWHSEDGAKAARELVTHIELISGAKLTVNEVKEGDAPPAGRPAIVVGRMALRLGLPAPPETVSGDGYRLLRKGNLLLMAGETDRSTFYAASHFLKTLGCRWFFGNPLGTVIPEMRTISVGALDVAEQPDFISRSVWGPNWHHHPWHDRNRCGGLGLSASHDWGHVPAKQYGEDHPEYYSVRGGTRRPGNWLCTSNPDVQRIFGDAVAQQITGKGVTSISISPPDGRGYCECERCRALDDEDYREPSSGHVVMTDRYVRFFNVIAARALKANPQAIVNFYAYADYSRPPLHAEKAPENLCAWIAPIRYCRFHSLSNPICSERQRLRGEIDQWQKVVSKMGWREYNYNLAETVVPLSKISVWKDDIPYLHRQGCIGLNIECLYFWHLYGPHTYLVTELAWDADADVDAIMADFYEKFCGPAAPHVRSYWERIDEAYRTTDIHVGSFYGLHVVWTPQLVEACRADLDAAAKAANTDLIRKRVAMFRDGLRNVEYYLSLRDATNRCDFAEAKKIYDEWVAHMDRIHKERIHYIGEYKHGYAPRFLSKSVAEGYDRTTGENRLLVRMPDEWSFRYDPDDEGEAKGWQGENVSADGWQKVRTYSATVVEQGVEEVLTWMWYRTDFEVKDVPAGRRLFVWVAEVDGKPTKVYLNGELVGQIRASRRPFEMEITGKLRKGRNVLAMQIDHRSISELALGGIIKPVLIYSAPPAE